MIYLDTNVIVYGYINPGDSRYLTSKNIIEKLILESNLILSPLSLQELLFVFNKLKLEE